MLSQVWNKNCCSPKKLRLVRLFDCPRLLLSISVLAAKSKTRKDLREREPDLG